MNIEVETEEDYLNYLSLLEKNIEIKNLRWNIKKEIPALPLSLRELNCVNCGLTCLPPLPNMLEELWCWNNQLTSILPLPDTLIDLQCDNNLLTSLPPLPKGLKYLFCIQCKSTYVTINKTVNMLPLLCKIQKRIREKLRKRREKAIISIGLGRDISRMISEY